jgi:hypothetical protein
VSCGAGPTAAHVDALLRRHTLWEAEVEWESLAPPVHDVPFSVSAMMRWWPAGDGSTEARKQGEDLRPGQTGGGGSRGDAQGDALWDVLHAVGTGVYGSDEGDEVMDDVESILAWDEPAWREPNPMSPGCGPVPLDECGAVPSHPRQSFADVPVLEPGPTFVFEEGAFTPCERRLLGQAWGLLQENLDVVDWAVCVSERMARQNQAAFHTQADPDCLRQRIVGDVWPPVTFTKKRERDGCKMSTSPSRSVVAMCVHGRHKLFNVAGDLYCEGSAAAGRCAVLAVAASLLHELSHTEPCRFRHDVVDDDGNETRVRCSIPYLIGSLFVVAVRRRYRNPRIDRHECCALYRDISIGDDARLPGFAGGCS